MLTYYPLNFACVDSGVKQTPQEACTQSCVSFVHPSVFIRQLLWAKGMLNCGEVGVRDVCYPPGTSRLVEDLTRKAGGGHITERPKYYTESRLQPGKR